jgi:hypothetical protein
MDDLLRKTLLYSTTPGIAGGVCAFLFTLKRGGYYNNKHWAKFFVEVVGALLTATFCTWLLDTRKPQAIAAFSIGIAWGSVVQIFRERITSVIEGILGIKPNKDKDTKEKKRKSFRNRRVKKDSKVPSSHQNANIEDGEKG